MYNETHDRFREKIPTKCDFIAEMTEEISMVAYKTCKMRPCPADDKCICVDFHNVESPALCKQYFSNNDGSSGNISKMILCFVKNLYVCGRVDKLRQDWLRLANLSRRIYLAITDHYEDENHSHNDV